MLVTGKLPRSDAVAMRVVALNVQHGGGRRTTAIVAALAAQQADVVVLSEFHPAGRGHALLDGLASLGLTHHASGTSPDPSQPNTVGIASRFPLVDAGPPIAEPLNGHRILEARIEGIVIAGVYFPGLAPKVAFWRNVFLPYARERLAVQALVIGDWNTGSHYLDEAGATLSGAAEFESMSAMGWCDAWRSLNPDGREFTWYSNMPHNNGFRLDHAFLSPSLTPRLLSARFEHETRRPGISDHSALVVDLR
jgi:exonuclease III